MPSLSDLLADGDALDDLAAQVSADAHDAALNVVRSAAEDAASARLQLVAVMAMARRLDCSLREIAASAGVSPQTVANMLDARD